MTLTDADVAYAAGLFDGEGCVHIGQVSVPTGRRHREQVQIANTDPRPLLWLKDRFGGWIRSAQSASNWKPAFFWVASGKDGERFLRLIQPYTIIKADQIAVALAFRETMGSRSVTIFEDREAMSQELRRMKRVAHALPDKEG